MIKAGNYVVIPDKYPDRTFNIKMPSPISQFDKVDVVWYYEGEYELSLLFQVTEWLKYITELQTLIIPYFPNARMDRTESLTHVFTLKYFCNFINNLGYKNVAILDPHSSVCMALVNNSVEIDVTIFIQDVMNRLKDENLVILYPDSGAVSRYSSCFNMSYCFGYKRNTELNIVGESLQDRNVLIMDDICTTGNTINACVNKAKEMGAKNIYAYVTHCEPTVLNNELLSNENLLRLYTTDSLKRNKHDKIEEIALKY